MARKQAQIDWDSRNMASITVRVKRQLLDDFKAACAVRGDAVNGVLRKAMVQYTYGGEDRGDGEQAESAGDGQKQP